jgi:hypothetical protein
LPGWADRSTPVGAVKALRGLRPWRAPRYSPESPAASQPLHGQIPELPVERDVAPDRTDRTRPGQPAGDRPPAQAAAKQVLLDAVVDAPEVIADVF